ncbi:hypothetical protein COY95_04405, partial [Candidatus Woesearchaeota archaeon CG_4_10_14_0_8_um_filter_47_5]
MCFIKSDGARTTLMVIDSTTNTPRDAEIFFYDRSRGTQGSKLPVAQRTTSGSTENSGGSGVTGGMRGMLDISDLSFDTLYITTGDDELLIEYFEPSRPSYWYGNNIQEATYTDRPVYRPNQTVFFKAVFWDTEDQKKFITRTPVEVTLHDPQYNTLATLHLTTDSYGALYSNLTLPPDANIGTYSL